MNKIFSLVVIISGLALQTSAQIATSSPYSRFGLGDLHENVSMTEANKNNSFGCLFGCGIFEMTKL